MTNYSFNFYRSKSNWRRLRCKTCPSIRICAFFSKCCRLTGLNDVQHDFPDECASTRHVLLGILTLNVRVLTRTAIWARLFVVCVEFIVQSPRRWADCGYVIGTWRLIGPSRTQLCPSLVMNNGPIKCDIVCDMWIFWSQVAASCSRSTEDVTRALPDVGLGVSLPNPPTQSVLLTPVLPGSPPDSGPFFSYLCVGGGFCLFGANVIAHDPSTRLVGAHVCVGATVGVPPAGLGRAVPDCAS